MSFEYCPHCGVTRAQLEDDQPCWNCGRVVREQSAMTRKQHRPIFTGRQCLFLIMGILAIVFLASIIVALVLNQQAIDGADDTGPVAIVVSPTSSSPPTSPPPATEATGPTVITATASVDTSTIAESTPVLRLGDDAATFAVQRQTRTPTLLPPSSTPIPLPTAAPSLTVEPDIFICPDAPSPRLFQNGLGAVVSPNGVRLYESPAADAFIIRPLAEGTTFTTLRGPQCYNSLAWWQVRLSDDTIGWLPETENDEYVVSPTLFSQ